MILKERWAMKIYEEAGNLLVIGVRSDVVLGTSFAYCFFRWAFWLFSVPFDQVGMTRWFGSHFGRKSIQVSIFVTICLKKK